ncbi:hypothetical protein AKN92_11340 [Thiopseudomonas alkaliphila]|nr:hypothetical protein AKN92_11340 [Thiopseudomonas alkaliphila]
MSTVIEKINVTKFRALENIELKIGRRITLICGKNGTSKSSMLGLLAQPFNFKKIYSDNVSDDVTINQESLLNTNFKSEPSEHFRISEIHDKPGSVDVTVTVKDGYTSDTVELKLGMYAYSDRKYRFVTRNNDSIKGRNKSRALTHPVIYLNLNRLLPITQREYEQDSIEYVEKNKEYFVNACKKVLLKTKSNNITSTKGSMVSSVVHGENYDHESVSVGEDNVGQLILAMMSFKKLKEEFIGYQGGLLLIDEADAGLFPAAQIEFINFLSRECKRLDVQVVLTSHSPIMIQEIYNLEKLDGSNGNYKTAYLTDTFGSVEFKEDYSWSQILADLNVETYESTKSEKLPKINLYLEDKEAFDFFKSIVTSRKTNKILNVMKEVSLGCKNYINLIDKNVPEFKSYSIIVLDADAKTKKEYKNICYLPSELPPDQLLFQYLHSLYEDDPYWTNEQGFTKAVFHRAASKIYEELRIKHEDLNVNLKDLVASVSRSRELFDNFYKNEDIKNIVAGGVKLNPFRQWAKKNPNEVKVFLDRLNKIISDLYMTNYGLTFCA